MKFGEFIRKQNIKSLYHVNGQSWRICVVAIVSLLFSILGLLSATLYLFFKVPSEIILTFFNFNYTRVLIKQKRHSRMAPTCIDILIIKTNDSPSHRQPMSEHLHFNPDSVCFYVFLTENLKLF